MFTGNPSRSRASTDASASSADSSNVKSLDARDARVYDLSQPFVEQLKPILEKLHTFRTKYCLLQVQKSEQYGTNGPVLKHAQTAEACISMLLSSGQYSPTEYEAAFAQLQTKAAQTVIQVPGRKAGTVTCVDKSTNTWHYFYQILAQLVLSIQYVEDSKAKLYEQLKIALAEFDQRYLAAQSCYTEALQTSQQSNAALQAHAVNYRKQIQEARVVYEYHNGCFVTADQQGRQTLDSLQARINGLKAQRKGTESDFEGIENKKIELKKACAVLQSELDTACRERDKDNLTLSNREARLNALASAMQGALQEINDTKELAMDPIEESVGVRSIHELYTQMNEEYDALDKAEPELRRNILMLNRKIAGLNTELEARKIELAEWTSLYDREKSGFAQSLDSIRQQLSQCETEYCREAAVNKAKISRLTSARQLAMPPYGAAIAQEALFEENASRIFFGADDLMAAEQVMKSRGVLNQEAVLNAALATEPVQAKLGLIYQSLTHLAGLIITFNQSSGAVRNDAVSADFQEWVQNTARVILRQNMV